MLSDILIFVKKLNYNFAEMLNIVATFRKDSIFKGEISENFPCKFLVPQH